MAWDDKNYFEDSELFAFVDGLIKDIKLSWEERMNRIIEWKKANRGMTGIHLTVYPNEEKSNEEIAKGFVMMVKHEAEGKFKDVTDENL